MSILTFFKKQQKKPKPKTLKQRLQERDKELDIIEQW